MINSDFVNLTQPTRNLTLPNYSGMTMMQVYPIGLVKYCGEGKSAKDKVQIEIYEQFSAGLKGIENADYLWILFWMHKLPESDRKTLQVHPRGDVTKEEQGVFALRSPMRPNPIGLTKVKLARREANMLIVEGLDAFDETPVLDIKRA
jgi:tRNA-Thr(GGU) m(6)t(6)A37 methyltransferase TsaA